MTEMSYQEKINRLVVIADELEKEAPELEKAVALYEEGKALLESCEKDLDEAQKRVMILNEDNTESPFE